MKAWVCSFFLWASAVSFLDVSYALIPGSPHDLSSKTDGICITCHLAENPLRQASIPLWNPASADRAFISYDSASGLAVDISRKCLSCHDGLNGSDRFSPVKFNAGSIVFRNGRNGNHPVSVAYIAKISKFKRVADNLAVKLFNGKVECATCHHPHLTANKKHLRISNTKSSLCLTCHDK